MPRSSARTWVPGPTVLLPTRYLLLATAAAALLALGLATTAPMAAAQSTSTPADTPDAFGARVRAYLLAHPEVILEAVQVLERRQKAAQAEALKGVIAARADELLRDPAAPLGGNPDGDVSVVEFFDYNCPYCRNMAPVVGELLAADNGIRLVYKEYPILGPGSELAARAALAAQRQGKYRVFHDALMLAPDKITEEAVMPVATSVGLDLDQLRQDMADPAIIEAIARNQALAAELGINGTPAFVIGDQVVPGATTRATLELLVRDARQKRRSEKP